MDEVDSDDGHQHQDASCHGVKEELDCRVHPSLRVAPDADQEIHGDQHDLPEYVKQDEVEGHQGSHHTGFEKEKGDHELLDPFLDGTEGTQNAKNGEKGGEEHQEEANPIDAEMIADPVILNPGMQLLELHLMGCVIEEKKQGQREEKLNQGDDQCQRSQSRGVFFVYEKKDAGTDQGKKRYKRENGKSFHQPTPISVVRDRLAVISTDSFFGSVDGQCPVHDESFHVESN